MDYHWNRGLPLEEDAAMARKLKPMHPGEALRLAKALGTTAQLWLNLQNDYDVQIAKRDLRDREARSRQESRSHRDRQQAEGGLTGGARLTHHATESVRLLSVASVHLDAGPHIKHANLWSSPELKWRVH